MYQLSPLKAPGPHQLYTRVHLISGAKLGLQCWRSEASTAHLGAFASVTVRCTAYAQIVYVHLLLPADIKLMHAQAARWCVKDPSEFAEAEAAVRQMGPDHALALATVTAGQDALAATLVAHIRQLQGALETSDRARIAALNAVRIANGLAARGQKKAARDLLAEVAAVDPVNEPRPTFDMSMFVPLAEAWPDAFCPKGAESAR